MWRFHLASWLLTVSLLQLGQSQEVGEASYGNLALGVADGADVSDSVAAVASDPDALNDYIRQVALANNVDDEDIDDVASSLFTYLQAEEPTEKRFSEFLGGRRKKFSEFLEDNKRFSEFLGGKKKRFSEFLGGKKRFSEFLGGKKKRFSEFLGGKRSAVPVRFRDSHDKRFSEFLGGKRNIRDYYNGKRFSEFLGGR